MSENGAEPHGNGESLRFSGEITEIAPALLAVQRAVTDPPREGTNPHFGSAYVRLEDLIHAVRPVLSEHEISLHQAPGMDAGMVTVETLLLHTSGEWVRCTARSPIQRDDPQGVGSAITYLRRYSLASILGLVHDADDDANRASPGRDDSGARSSGSGSRATEKQVKYIRALLKERAVDEEDKTQIQKALAKGISKTGASRTIEKLEGMEKADGGEGASGEDSGEEPEPSARQQTASGELPF